MAQLEFDRVSKRYQARHDEVLAVSDLSLTIDDGELVVFVGPSGCGKSTALRMIAGLEDISDGEIRIDGQRVNDREPSQRDIAMVFQNYALYPHMSVYRNIGYPLRIQRLPKHTIDERVRETARILQLTEQLGRLPGQLSGGQRQRVAMGRALIRQPKAFLMDEPLSNLDAKLRVYMRSEISAIQREVGITTVYVTHDQVEAMTMGDRVAVLLGGVLQQIASPSEVFWNPANMFVAAFIGSPPMNLFEARVAAAEGRQRLWLGEQPLDVAPDHPVAAALGTYHDRKVVVGIRPEHLRIAADGDDDRTVLGGTVAVVEQLGTELVCHLDIGMPRLSGGEDADPDAAVEGEIVDDAKRSLLVARIQARTVPAVGERLSLVVDTAELRFFDPDTTRAITT